MHANPKDAKKREAPSKILAPLLICFSPFPGSALCKSGYTGVLFVLPEVLGPSFVLFSWVFPFLVFYPQPFWTPFSYSNYLTYRCSLLPSPICPLLIYFDSWTPYSRFLCNIALYSIGLYIHHQSHPQLGVVFTLAPSLHYFWSYFTLFSSSILGTY